MDAKLSVSKPFGDRHAAYGTKDWAQRFRTEIQMAVADLELAPSAVETNITLGEKFGAWQLLEDRYHRPFPNFDAFCRAPKPWGLGKDPSHLRGEIETAKQKVAETWKASPPVAKVGAPKGNANAKKNGDPGNNGDQVTIDSAPKRGHSAEYLAGRIKAKAAKGDEAAVVVAEKLEAGGYESMRAAARDAGILKPPDPFRAVVRALDKLSLDRLRELRDTITKFIEAKEAS